MALSSRLQCSTHVAKRVASRTKPSRLVRLRSVNVQAVSAAQVAGSLAGSLTITCLAFVPAAYADVDVPNAAAEFVAYQATQLQSSSVFAMMEAPTTEATLDEAEAALAGMLQVAEQLSAVTSELLSVKDGSSPAPLPDVALKMSQQALALASQAVALSSYDLPESERSLVEQISAAARQVSVVANTLAMQS